MGICYAINKTEYNFINLFFQFDNIGPWTMVIAVGFIIQMTKDICSVNASDSLKSIPIQPELVDSASNLWDQIKLN